MYQHKTYKPTLLVAYILRVQGTEPMNNMNSSPEKINDLKFNKSTIKEVSAQAITNEIAPNSQTNAYPIKFSNMKKYLKYYGGIHIEQSVFLHNNNFTYNFDSYYNL